MESGAGVILVAAGAGRRFGRPKSDVPLAGIPLVERAAAPFGAFREKVVVVRSEEAESFRLPGWKVVAGGARRRDSVENGLRALAPDTRFVLVHDAARPLLPAAVVERVLRAAMETGAAIPAVPVHDTIKQVEDGLVRRTLDRKRLVAVQTPQGFRADLLRRALASTPADATDEAALVEGLGEAVAVVPGDPRNLKITTPFDLRLAEALLGAADGSPPLE